MIRIVPIRTGSVSARRLFAQRLVPGPPLLNVAALALDRHYLPPMPIYCWLIEHPEGTILVDTGARAQWPALSGLRGLVQRQAHGLFIWHVDEEDEAGPRLEALSLEAASVDTIVITHCHADHLGGARHFPGARVLVHEIEWRRPHFALPWAYPPAFTPTLFSFGSEPWHSFDGYYPLTRDGAVVALPLPGHTHGHCAVAISIESVLILLCGDLVGTQDQLLAGAFPGAHADYPAARKSRDAIMALAARHHVVLLPSHDPDAEKRLAARTLLLKH